MHEVTADGKTVHYSPNNGRIEEGYLYTGTGFWTHSELCFLL